VVLRISQPRNALQSSRLALGLLALLLPLGAAQPRTAPTAPYPDPPQVLFKELFVAVQSQSLYPDGKTFVDAVPKLAPEQILARYQAARPDSLEALRHFVDENFSLPALALSVPSVPEHKSVTAHIDGLWGQLTRTTSSAAPFASLLPLPKPYVVPGGRFREIYYWDSYFTMLGLIESGRHELVQDMVDDFAHLIDAYGHVPNGTRTYYLSRSQPPFFFEMVGLLGREGSGEAFGRYLPQLRSEYAFWMEGAEQLQAGSAHRRVVAMPDGAILNRYWDDRDTPRDESWREDTELARSSGRPVAQVFRDIRAAAESGWDFSSRWFADPRVRASIDTTQIVPIDLNSLLFGLENAIEAGCQARGDRGCADEFARRARARRAAVDRYLWDAAAGSYRDYQWTQRARIARLSAATLYPLFVGLASPAQAAAVAASARKQLLDPGGIVTTPLVTGQQWDAPNGWAPLQWIAIAGFTRSDHKPLAAAIACRWMVNVEEVYQRSGKLVEKYDVVSTGRAGGGGEYPLQDGFGWTNGVLRKLLVLYPAFGAGAPAGGCPGGAAH
jgi:alpha,alpha-trehalase